MPDSRLLMTDSMNETALHVTRDTTVSDIDSGAWDALVSRDTPHLRFGFMEAIESSGFMQKPYYLRAWRGDRLVGVTAAYLLEVDLLTLAVPEYKRWADTVRKEWAPRLFFLSTILCGPLLSGCNRSFCVAPELTPVEEQRVIGALIDGLEAIPEGSALAVIECTDEVSALYRPQMASRGFLEAPSFPNTRLDVHWSSLDEYIASMRKAFRRSVVKDRRAVGEIDFEMVDDFSEIADEAWVLYNNVLERADRLFEDLTPGLFRALARFEQTRMLTARDRATGALIGMELLLCGDTVLQDLYTGLDYRYNAEQRLYFNLIYPVIGYAGEQGYRSLHMGQTSYAFKARLGARPEPISMFVKHRNPILHRLLASFRRQLFPVLEPPAFNVFREPEPRDEGNGE